MKKLAIILLFAILTSCGSLIEPPESNLEPPKTNIDYKNIIGNPVKIDKLEVAQYDFPIGMHWDEAKKICDSLGNDWRMPNKNELNILFQYKDRIGGFNGNWYWSSTEDENGAAWMQAFDNKIEGTGFKSKPISLYVRAVRSF
jgi:hypothetical protein